MTTCIPFIPVEPAPCCVDALVIGTTSVISGNVKVSFENLSTGRQTILDGTTNGAGLLTVDTTEFKPSLKNPYRISAALAANDISDRLNITISNRTEKYIILQFVSMYDSNNELITDTSYTLTV